MAFNPGEIIDCGAMDNTLEGCLVALGVFVLLVAVFKVFKFVVIHKLKKISAKTRTDLDDFLIVVIDSVRWPFYVLLSLFIALQSVHVPDIVGTVLYYMLGLAVVYYVVRAMQSLIDYGAGKAVKQRQKEGKDVDTSVIDFLCGLLKGVLWFVALLLILSNLGYDVSTLIAGLGICGIAVAFALQNVLADIFASFSIYFDKPFKCGDFIIVGKDLGVVKKIGIKTTRLESLWGQEIVISNRDLTSARVNNYKKMKKRRIHFTFGVVYSTPAVKMRKAIRIVKDIFAKIELAELARVHFKEFGDFSLNFEVAYYVDTGDYNKYMDIQQEIYFSIKEQFEREGIEFAYPTQTVFVNK